MNLDLAGKHALVCGASEGIGYAAAMALASQGAQVTLLARREARLQDVLQQLPRPQQQPHAYCVADMADSDQLRASVTALAQQSPVHILINNTGGPAGGPAHIAEPAAYIDAFQRHLIAGQTLLQSVLPGMRAAQWGRVLNVVSTSVYEPIPNLGVSNTIRGAVAGWAKTLSRELAPHGITVNNILPGYTRTGRLQQILNDRSAAAGTTPDAIAQDLINRIPVGRFAEASELGNVIAFFSSPAAAYITGQSLAVDGGQMQSI